MGLTKNEFLAAADRAEAWPPGHGLLYILTTNCYSAWVAALHLKRHPEDAALG